MFRENENDENSEAEGTTLSTESLPVTVSSKLQVFMRMRPISSDVLNVNKGDIYQIQDSTTMLIKHCNITDPFKRSKVTKLSDNVYRKKFIFSKIFNLETDQSKFFDDAIKPMVIDFLNNHSTTIISYGTADSGKSYTLFGSLSDPGVIARSIELIFSSLNCISNPWYKPKRFNSVIEMNENDRMIEMDRKDKLLSCRLTDKSMYEEAYKILENSELHQNLVVIKESMYSVWISFIEIYNDTIFDLLEVDAEGKNMPLKLATDKNNCTYLQGIRNVCATTGLEAYEILNAGQTKLSTLALPNYRSSRSHSIFTIKLFKYEKYSTASEVEVSSITFCDLAGTGRIQKSVGNGKQLKESKCINTSLLALGRCFKGMAEGHSRHSTASFRDSKLTRLLQHSLCGKQNILLLINVNPAPELFAETQNVLSFASIAMKITPESPKEDKKYVDHETMNLSAKAHVNYLSTSSKILNKQENSEVMTKNQQLLAEIKELKSANLKNEFMIRDELTNMFKKQLNDLEENWKNRMVATKKEYESLMKINVNSVHSYYRKQMEECINRKCKRIDRGDCEALEDVEIAEVEKVAKLIPSSVECVESTITEYKQSNTQKCKYNFELSFLKSKLRELSRIISSSRKVIEDDVNCKELDSIKDTNNEEDIMLPFSDIKNFLITSIELNKSVQKERKNMLTKESQCNLEESLIREFYKDIQDLLFPNAIELPSIDHSLNSSLETLDQILYEDKLTDILPRIKKSITANISKTMKLEIENSENLRQIEILKNKTVQQERELLQIKIQFQESESTRMSLNKKVEDFKIKLKKKEFFENLNSSLTESEISFSNEIDHGLNCSEHQQTTDHSHTNNSSYILFESDADKLDNRASRSSSGSSRNDSGLASSIDCPACKVTDEKYCQTNTCHDEKKHHVFQERLMQLKCDYKNMKAQHVQESLKVTKLSQELEFVKEAMVKLKENNLIQEQANRAEIDCLKSEKHLSEINYNELSKRLQEVRKQYEGRVNDLQIKLKVHEERQHKAAKCLEDYWEKKVDRLEKELNEKTLNENEFLNKIEQYEKDFLRINKFSDKVNDFQYVIDSIKKEKIELCSLLNEQLANQLNIKDQFHSLIIKIEERDNQVISLKSQLGDVIRTNLLNSRKAKELGSEVTKLTEKISTMNENILESEEARTNLERTSNKEIDTLRTRLQIFEENAELLTAICESNGGKQNDVDKLKSRLSEKEKELEFIKKNRNATIQRYECMVRQLQDALKMSHHSNKLKKIFPQKHKYFFNELRETSVCGFHDSEPQICDWKSLNDDQIHLLSLTGTSSIAHSFGDNAKSPSFKEEPTRLVNDVSEKSLEAGNRFCSQTNRSPCKDYLLSSPKTLTAPNIFEDHASRKNCERKLQLPWKRSFKKYC